MANNKRIQTTDLDFDGIKENLKNFLRGQEQFSDYDFEGSGLSILLDVLAYNTHYNALYQNLAVNESFLDSASKRSSVVSKAKELGYIPTSARSATATVDVLMLNNQIDAPDSIEINRYTPFTTTVNDRSFTFYTDNNYIAYRQGNQYIFNNVVLKEGVQLRNRYIVDTVTSFRLENLNIDTTSLRVTVQENAQSSIFETYTRSDLLLDIDGNSLVYFLKETDDQFYEVEFGNGVVGKQLDTGNVVTIDYIVCNTDNANGAKTFTYNSTLPPFTQAFVTTVDVAFGGSEAEDVDSIKWNAPRKYASQNRCVTLDDYRNIIIGLYPNARSVNVWGGEQNFPPTYGDVFISVKPESAEVLSPAEKDYVLNEVLGPRKVVTIHPKFVDPSYLYVEMKTSFYYNPQETNRTSNDIALLIRNALLNYNNTDLNRFQSVFKYSYVNRLIDTSEDSIKSSITTIKIHREVPVVYTEAVEYDIDIGNPIYNSGVPEESIISTGFNALNVSQTLYIDDLPEEDSDVGQLRLFYYVGNSKVVLRNIGTVNYSTGIIQIRNLVITGLPENTFKFIIKPQSNDVASVRNQIVSIAPEMLTITPVVDTTADKYQFTSSRN